MKILVVEDEALLRHHLHTRLGERAFVVDAVADAEEALYRAQEFNHDIAIVDLGNGLLQITTTDKTTGASTTFQISNQP